MDHITNPTEKRIARKVVKALLDAGYQVAVNDGEEMTVKPTDKTETIMGALGTTDMDYVLAYRDGKRVGGAVLVWGNDEDLLSNYHMSLDHCLAGVVD